MNTASDPSATAERRRLVLVRHGETAENAAGRFLGRRDPSLTSSGADGARRLAPVVAALDGIALVSSPAKRARETAQLLDLGDPVVDPAFREVDFGDWEGLTQTEVAEHDPDGFARFDHGAFDGFPGGETIAAAGARALDGIDRHRGPCLVVITHATLVRVIVTALLGLPVERYRTRFGRPGHLSWTELEGAGDGWRLLTYDSRPVEDGA